MPDIHYTADMLEMLDRLWAQTELSLTTVRHRMETRFGIKFRESELRDVARRNELTVVTLPAPAIPVAAMTLRPVAKVWRPTQIRDTQCKNPVPPGRYPVPPGGYRMFQLGSTL